MSEHGLGSRIAAAAVLLALAGCGGTGDPRGIDRKETLLTVNATGRVETTPDQATFTAGISTIAADAKAASQRNAERMGRIVSAVRRLGVAERNLRTRELTVNRISYGANRGRFEATNTITVRVREVKQAGAIVAAATAEGANIVSGPSLSVSDPEKAQLSGYGNAYKAARAKAEAYAAAADLKVARVLTIRDGGAATPYSPYAIEPDFARQQSPAPAPPVMAGADVDVVSVSVDFALAAR